MVDLKKIGDFLKEVYGDVFKFFLFVKSGFVGVFVKGILVVGVLIAVVGGMGVKMVFDI